MSRDHAQSIVIKKEIQPLGHEVVTFWSRAILTFAQALRKGFIYLTPAWSHCPVVLYDRYLRRPTLYPAELRVLIKFCVQA